MGLSIATRDYARQQRPKGTPPRSKAAPRKAAAGNKNAPRGSAALGLPLWAWMVVSLSLIVLAAVLYYISRPVAPMDMAPSSEDKTANAKKVKRILSLSSGILNAFFRAFHIFRSPLPFHRQIQSSLSQKR